MDILMVAKEGTRKRARRQPPEERRRDLLAATVVCLARFGPRGATGREICREAGVSHGLLRHYFENPENLLLETYDSLCSQYLKTIARGLADCAQEPWAAIDCFVEELFAERWANAEILGAWSAFWTLVRTSEEFAAVSTRFNNGFRAMLTDAAKRLSPINRTTMPVDDAIAILSALMDGLWLEVCLAPDRTSRERAISLCRQAARAILGR